MGLNFALFETFKVVVDAVTASVRMRIGEFNNRLSKRDASEQLPLPSVVRNGLSGTALYVCIYVCIYVIMYVCMCMYLYFQVISI